MSNKNLFPEARKLPASFETSISAAVLPNSFSIASAFFSINSEASSPIVFGNKATPNSALGITFISFSPYFCKTCFILGSCSIGVGVILTPLEPNLVVNFLP